MKPLGRKNYGSVPHLIGSKLGAGDRHVHEGQHRICTDKVRDKHDVIIVQEKYDGSNVGIAKKDGKILALTRSGYLAHTSPYEHHHVFEAWVKQNTLWFKDVLNEGERIVGEWLYQAHGLRYFIVGDPFIAFDLFTPENERMPYIEFYGRMYKYGVNIPNTLHEQSKPLPISEALNRVLLPYHRKIKATQKPEGVVYRVERKGKVDFLAKYVRHDFEPGKYLPEISGNDPVYNCPIDQFLNRE